MLLGLVLASLAVQDTTALSERARVMLDDFRVPYGSEVTIETRFSTGVVYIGEQVELVTAAWFPRDLRDRLRRSPTLRAPALSGLWSAPTQTTPTLAETRRVDGRIYDLFVSHQTLFPLGSGRIESPPAVLSYSVPASVSFFAPEERKTLSSESVSLVVLPVPPRLITLLGNGPTARGLQVRWRLPVAGVISGSPALIELVISGVGNVNLWPTPDIAWPSGLRVYPEPVEERIERPAGIIQGEKRFRYTVVADSGGVYQLPRVRYPFFDPVAVTVHVAAAAPSGLAVRPPGEGVARAALPVTTSIRTPVATTLVRSYPWVLILLALLPLGIFVRRRRAIPSAVRRPATSREVELRRLLSATAIAAPEHLATALRQRGIARTDAEALRSWLDQLDRARYGAGGHEPEAPPILDRVLERLRGARIGIGLTMLLTFASGLPAQTDTAISRYRNGDAAGAARLFGEVVSRHSYSPSAWSNLGAARWVAGDDVGAAAAWLRGLELDPRDAQLRAALSSAASVPNDVRALVPRIPISRDEIIIAAVFMWVVTGALFWRRRRRGAIFGLAVTVVLAAYAVRREIDESPYRALVRSSAPIRVSPLTASPEIGNVQAWSMVHLERRSGDWWLVTVPNGARGWLNAASVAPLSRLD
jgi:hypothetical protein